MPTPPWKSAKKREGVGVRLARDACELQHLQIMLDISIYIYKYIYKYIFVGKFQSVPRCPDVAPTSWTNRWLGWIYVESRIKLVCRSFCHVLSHFIGSISWVPSARTGITTCTIMPWELKYLVVDYRIRVYLTFLIHIRLICRASEMWAAVSQKAKYSFKDSYKCLSRVLNRALEKQLKP